MEDFVRLLLPALLVWGFVRLCAAPLGLAWKLVVNAGAGFVCLWLANLISGFTGLLFPVNAVTALIAGFLGLPGLALLGAIQLFV